MIEDPEIVFVEEEPEVPLVHIQWVDHPELTHVPDGHYEDTYSVLDDVLTGSTPAAIGYAWSNLHQDLRELVKDYCVREGLLPQLNKAIALYVSGN